MNWKNWKVGLFVALLSGIFTGLLCMAIDMTWRQILFILLVNVGKDGLLFLKSHPADQITFDTTRGTKPVSQDTQQKKEQ